MDLRRAKNEEKLELCRKYYLGGFFLLPFLWVVNSIWFFKEAFFKPSYEEQKQIKTYVIRSVIGSVIWTAVIVTWVVIFQLKRAEWGASADYISFIIPRGEPYNEPFQGLCIKPDGKIKADSADPDPTAIEEAV